MTMITPSYLGETIEYSSLNACRSTLEAPTRGHEVRGRTGVWYLSTRCCVRSNELADHFRYLIAVVCPEGRDDHIAALRDLMARDGLEADVSCFWYGSAGARSPQIPAFARDVFARLPATIETDFDTD